MNAKDHVERVAVSVQEQLARLASAEVDVPRRFSLRTRPDHLFPTLCFSKACLYVVTHRVRGIRYVFGTARGGGMGEHGWVELPGRIVFDGVLQRFYDLDKYYECEAARPWYRFTRSAVVWLLGQELPQWRWDWAMMLPWARSALDPAAEVLLIDRKDAENYLTRARMANALPLVHSRSAGSPRTTRSSLPDQS
jgi:hypothetical protein